MRIPLLSCVGLACASTVLAAQIQSNPLPPSPIDPMNPTGQGGVSNPTSPPVQITNPSVPCVPSSGVFSSPGIGGFSSPIGPPSTSTVTSVRSRSSTTSIRRTSPSTCDQRGRDGLVRWIVRIARPVSVLLYPRVRPDGIEPDGLKRIEQCGRKPVNQRARELDAYKHDALAERQSLDELCFHGDDPVDKFQFNVDDAVDNLHADDADDVDTDGNVADESRADQSSADESDEYWHRLAALLAAVIVQSSVTRSVCGRLG